MLASVIPLPSKASKVNGIDAKGEAAQQAQNSEIVSADVAFERIVEKNGQLVGIIQVEVEETLGHYADWAGVATQKIRRLNGLRYGEFLRLHQKIRIPLGRTNAETFEQNRYEYHKRLQEDFYAAYRVGELQSYRCETRRQHLDSVPWTVRYPHVAAQTLQPGGRPGRSAFPPEIGYPDHRKALGGRRGTRNRFAK